MLDLPALAMQGLPALAMISYEVERASAA